MDSSGIIEDGWERWEEDGHAERGRRAGDGDISDRSQSIGLRLVDVYDDVTGKCGSHKVSNHDGR